MVLGCAYMMLFYPLPCVCTFAKMCKYDGSQVYFSNTVRKCKLFPLNGHARACKNTLKEKSLEIMCFKFFRFNTIFLWINSDMNPFHIKFPVHFKSSLSSSYSKIVSVLPLSIGMFTIVHFPAELWTITRWQEIFVCPIHLSSE